MYLRLLFIVFSFKVVDKCVLLRRLRNPIPCQCLKAWLSWHIRSKPFVFTNLSRQVPGPLSQWKPPCAFESMKWVLSQAHGFLFSGSFYGNGHSMVHSQGFSVLPKLIVCARIQKRKKERRGGGAQWDPQEGKASLHVGAVLISPKFIMLFHSGPRDLKQLTGCSVNCL